MKKRQRSLSKQLSLPLRNKLKMPDEEEIKGVMSLIQLGVDSLIAVDLQTWVVKELVVGMPVLKILDGSLIGELAAEVAAKLTATKETIP